jgi:tripartite-type tricarboxylate transporter receptor subunit TctC
MQRRTLLKLAAGAAMLPALPPIARAQPFPSRPVRMVVPVGPGGAPDIIARLIGQSLSERLGQSFVVENRPAGAGNVGTVEVVKAAPDGYTLLVMSPSHATFVTLYERLPYNTLRDIAPVAGLIRSINVLVVHPSVPARTVPELIAYAKANPGKLSMASTGVGGNPHLAGELFKLVAGIDMVHVPYRSPAAVLTDLLGGQVQVYFASTSSASEYVRTGKLRAIGVAAAMRSDALPDVPSIGEYLPGFEVSTWFGIGAPISTPPEIIGKLNQEINTSLAEPRIKARLADLGAIPMPLSPAEYGKLIADDIEKWAKVIRAAKIKAE